MLGTEIVPTVLIVEDEALVRMHGADILQEAGFDVLEAADSDEALAILTKPSHIQLLFSDIDMPGALNGLQLASLVHERWPHIRLLLTSGHHRVDATQLPAKGEFVRKPWVQEALIERIRGLLTAA